MLIKELYARKIKDTRGDDTIEISLKTENGKFIASAPNGKSRGRFEAKPWQISLKKDIEFVNKQELKKLDIESFDELFILENIFKENVGANTMIAIEYVFLKAIAKKQRKEVWEIINPRAKKFPFPVGNVIGGGSHSVNKPRPDFQEFHIIPCSNNFKKNLDILKRAHENAKRILKNVDVKFKGKMNDENAWATTINNWQALEVIQNVKDNMIDEFKERIHVGIDCAASQFYKGLKYRYNNEKSILSKKEQIKIVNEIAKEVYYLEDPIDENDLDSWNKLKSKGLIVGDDLTVTNLSRLKKAVSMETINAIIIKPNQNGSLLEVKGIVEYCNKNKIKTIFSHRSGETSENILADLAFGFQADFIKTGSIGKGRKEKLNRLVEIERSLLQKSL